MGIERTPQERLDSAVYLTYVEWHFDHAFYHVNVDEFKKNVLPKTQRIRDFDSGICESRSKYLDDAGNILGEVWRDGQLRSYWIKRKFK